MVTFSLKHLMSTQSAHCWDNACTYIMYITDDHVCRVTDTPSHTHKYKTDATVLGVDRELNDAYKDHA